MRFNPMLAALCCLCFVLPAIAAETATPGPTLQYERALKQYRKFDHGGAASSTDDHQRHNPHDDHAGHDKPLPGPHEQMPHDEHAGHQHMHGE
ncbi:hypothetical protein [Methylobacillus sp.]|uniref:hypothetical protein n=1 Tax=Methylobacillus sp. TaxID=56818 RepID=UPI002FDF4E09